MRRVMAVALALAAATGGDYARVPGATFGSVLPEAPGSAAATVAPFLLQRTPVTNAQFLAFTRAHPEWRRDRVPALLADPGYLNDWSAADALGPGAAPEQPVTHVSWFAASAYCEAEDARLPTWHEWEWAAAADEKRADARGDPQFRQRVLSEEVAGGAGRLPAVARRAPDVHGIHDLHGLVWEWVDDFAALMVSPDSRDAADPDTMKFCGAGAMLMEQKENYGVLMRISMLSSVRARETTGRLGFRCAKQDRGRKETGATMGPARSGTAVGGNGSLTPVSLPSDSLYQLRIALTDHDGKAATLDLDRGHPTLIALFYGSCRNSCPLLLPAIQRLESQLDPASRARVRVLLVTFDPERDTPAGLKMLGEHHGADLARWTFARASAQDVRKLAAALGVQYRRLPDGSFNHTSLITLLDDEGRVQAQTPRLTKPEAAFAGRLAALAAAKGAAGH